MRILWVSPWYPFPPSNGAKQRIFALLCALSRDHHICLVSFVRDGEIVDRSAMDCLHAESVLVPFKVFEPNRLKAILGYFSVIPRSLYSTYSAEMERAIRDRVGSFQPDLVVFSELTTAVYGPLESLPCILEDFETSIIYKQWKTAPSYMDRFRHWLTWKKLRAYLKRKIKGYSSIIVVSEIEKRILAEILPEYKPLYIVPNGVDLQHNQSRSVDPLPGKLIYNGALTYQANFDAVEYFLSEIMPLIKEEVEIAGLTVTGSTHGVDIGRLSKDKNIELTGYLEDIRPTLESSWACVVPLRIGGGTRLKILEAMALGVPVVSTPIGAEGLDVTPEVNILLGENPEKFAQQTIRLLRDIDLRSRLSKAGRQLVEANYEWQKIGDKFGTIVNCSIEEFYKGR